MFFVFFSVLLLFPLASNSEATLWDLQIQASVENTPINSGDRPIVSGVIIDHASKPVHKATVNIRSGTMSVFTTTSEAGEFNAELGKHARIPGIYTVNIVATTSDGKTGIISIQFQVKGELEQTTVNKAKLSTPEAKKYLEASPEDFDKNPIGFTLYNYYQKLYQEYLEDEKIGETLAQEQALIEEKKEVAKQLRLEAIEEFNPGYGIFSGPQYENYVNSLDEEVRDTIVEHLNFTKNLYLEAHSLRSEILENGGTAEEAQLAFLEKISISRDMIENFDNNSDGDKETKFDESLEDSNNEIANELLHPDTIGPLHHDTRDPLHSDTIGLLHSDTIELLDPDTIGPLHHDTRDPLHPDTRENLINEISSGDSPIQVNFDGINVEVEFKESIFYVNINGKVLEFLVNGTQIIQFYISE